LIINADKFTNPLALPSPGLPDFSGHNIPTGGNMCIQNYQKLPNGQKYLYLTAVIYSKLAIPTLSIPRPSKIYPNRDFWFENIYHLAAQCQPTINIGGAEMLSSQANLFGGIALELAKKF
jgi:hypothetical protein